MKAEGLMSVPDAAKYLGVSVGFIWTRIREDMIPVVRMGRRVMLLQQDLDTYIMACRTGPVVASEPYSLAKGIKPCSINGAAYGGCNSDSAANSSDEVAKQEIVDELLTGLLKSGWKPPDDSSCPSK